MAVPRTLNIFILGDSGVGKTSLLHSLLTQEFPCPSRPTVTPEMLSTCLHLPSPPTAVSLCLWDVSGDMSYLSLSSVFFQSADCCILLYDITNPKSLDNLQTWYTEFKELSNPERHHSRPVMVIGMKKDRENDRKVPFSKAYLWAKNMGNWPYYEVAAMDFEKVQSVFSEIASMVVHGAVSRPQAPLSLLTKLPAKRPNRCC